MKAAEARKIVNALQDDQGLRLQQKAKNSIENSAKAGRSFVSFYVPPGEQFRLANWLKDFGYKVDYGNDPQEGVWFNVFW